jgi:hypothetical protein
MANQSCKTWVQALAAAALLAACVGNPPAENPPGADTLSTDGAAKESEAVKVGGRVLSIPSPAQTALAMRKAGLKYQKGAMAPLEKGETTASRLGQAALLGVLGADLSYTTVHQDGQRALMTLQAIEKLASKLELSNAFDRKLLERFKGNMSNEDSLLRLSGAAFRAADQYLKTNDADDASAWIAVGGWTETMHLILSDPASAKSEALMVRVAEQRSTLDNLVAIVDAANKDGHSNALLAALKDARSAMDGVEVEYTYEPPVTEAAKKTTYINGKSTARITAAQFAAIAAKVAALRNMILA